MNSRLTQVSTLPFLIPNAKNSNPFCLLKNLFSKYGLPFFNMGINRENQRFENEQEVDGHFGCWNFFSLYR
jgi:hypothetical protein